MGSATHFLIIQLHLRIRKREKNNYWGHGKTASGKNWTIPSAENERLKPIRLPGGSFASLPLSSSSVPSKVCLILLAHSRLSEGSRSNSDSLAQQFASSRQKQELTFYFSQHQPLQNIQVPPTPSFKTIFLCLVSPFITRIRFCCKMPYQHESLVWISYNYYYAFVTLLMCFSKRCFINHVDFPISFLWMLSPKPFSPWESIIIPVVMSRTIQLKIFLEV